jgi:hypothetical protein
VDEHLANYGVYPPTASESFDLSAVSKAVRHRIEECCIADGVPPSPQEIGEQLSLDRATVLGALRELQQAVQVMFVPGTENIIKVPPFSAVPTRHRVFVDGEWKGYAGCAGEASAVDGLFPGKTVRVVSACPECWEPIELVVKDRELLSMRPGDAVLHIGVHPDRFRDDWIVTCDSINFFPDLEHVARWEEMVSARRGGTMPASGALKWADGVARSRFWNYDRGPEVARGLESFVEHFERNGGSAGPWRDQLMRP